MGPKKEKCKRNLQKCKKGIFKKGNTQEEWVFHIEEKKDIDPKKIVFQKSSKKGVHKRNQKNVSL